MTRCPQIAWRRVGVMGLARSGRATAGFLARQGVEVVAVDAKPRGELAPSVGELERQGVSVHLGFESSAVPFVFADCEAVVASPGVPSTEGPLRDARQLGIPVLAEVELASRFLRGVVMGITGSNGKSTVTVLVGQMLRDAGITARVCGNIGTPLIQVAEEDMRLPEDRARSVHYVVELSSFQLEGIELLRPHVAVLLNLSPDHLDRYESPQDYFAAKARIFMNQTREDLAIVNWDDEAARQAASDLAARLMPFSLTQDLPEGAFLRGDDLVLRQGGDEELIMQASAVPLRGRHNLENVLASAAAAVSCGALVKGLAKTVTRFQGLPHRLELVGSGAGVSYYDDSKATNVGAALRAVESFTEPLVLLLGGRDKGGDFEVLRTWLQGTDKLRALITFGEAGPEIARRMEGAAPQTARVGSLSEAVDKAREMAQAGDVVLLAPACASFDAYDSFGQRGDAFKALVTGMAGGRH